MLITKIHGCSIYFFQDFIAHFFAENRCSAPTQQQIALVRQLEKGIEPLAVWLIPTLRQLNY